VKQSHDGVRDCFVPRNDACGLEIRTPDSEDACGLETRTPNLKPQKP